MNRRQYPKQMIHLREKCYDCYMSYEKYARYFLRFLMAFVLFLLIDNRFDYSGRISGVFFVFLLSLIGAILPDGILVFLLLAVSVGKIYFLSPILAIAVLFVSLIVYFILLQYCDKSILLTALIPLALFFKVPALPAIIAGLYFSPTTALLSILCGIVAYCMYGSVLNCEDILAKNADLDMVKLVQKFIDGMIKNSDMYTWGVTLSIVCLLVFFVSRMKLAYAFEISIGMAVVVNMIFSIVCNILLKGQLSILWIVLGSLIAGILGYALLFLHMILDYGNVEELQFEDDEYYYYVKAVPKLRMEPKKKI